jgi:predicted adenine nucleotide alpha hydrolase (AANH) superfamily ATPase
MTVLLHSCCGPCLGGSYDILKNDLQEEGIETFWFNPNIHPYLEYRERLLSFQKICIELGLKTHYGPGDYGLEYFLKEIDGKYDQGRCKECYRLRFDQLAHYTAANSFRAFSTTLLVSPYQQHEMIVEEAEKAAKKYGTSFHYCDFRPGFKNTHESARQYDLYKQKYCGCIFSEHSRFKGDKRYQLPECE